MLEIYISYNATYNVIRNSSRLSPSEKNNFVFTWGKARGVPDAYDCHLSEY
jgi:hypothetical protein